MKVGDRVLIKNPQLAALSHRKRVTGQVTHVNGAYISVRPSWCRWTAEYYPNELQKLSS